MNIEIQRLPDGRLQAYGEDLEAASSVITDSDAKDFYDRLRSAVLDLLPYEAKWEPMRIDTHANELGVQSARSLAGHAQQMPGLGYYVGGRLNQ